jgi:protein-arginine kinase activator protein McsA
MNTTGDDIKNILNSVIEHKTPSRDIFLIANQNMNTEEFREIFFDYIDRHQKEILAIAHESVETKNILLALLEHKTVTINLYYCPENYLENIIIDMYVENEQYEKAALFRDVIKEKKKKK